MVNVFISLLFDKTAIREQQALQKKKLDAMKFIEDLKRKDEMERMMRRFIDDK